MGKAQRPTFWQFWPVVWIVLPTIMGWAVEPVVRIRTQMECQGISTRDASRD